MSPAADEDPVPGPCPSPVDLELMAVGEAIGERHRAHVARCAVCRTWLAEIEANNRMLAEVASAGAQRPPEDLARNAVRDRAAPTAADDIARVVAPARRAARRIAVFVAVVLIVGLGAVLVGRGGAPGSSRHSRPGHAPAGAASAERPVDGAVPLPRAPGEATIRAIAWLPDGARFVAADAEGRVRIREAATGVVLHATPAAGAPITCLAVRPAGDLIASGDREGALRLWRPGGAEPVREAQVPVAVTALVFARDGMAIAIGAEDGSVRVHRIDGGTEPLRLEGHARAVTALAWAEDGTALFSASADGTVRVWDPSSGTLAGVVQTGGDPVTALTLAPESVLIAIGSADGAVSLRDAASGHLLLAIRTGDRVRAMALRREASLSLVTASATAIAVWDTTSGKRLAANGCEPASVLASIGPRGRRALTVAADGGTIVRAIPIR